VFLVVIFLLSAPCHAIAFFCVFFVVLFLLGAFTMKHYGHSLPYCLLLGLLAMLVLASRCSLPFYFFLCSSSCYCLLLSIARLDVGFGHSLMCSYLLLGVPCHAIISRPPHCAITFWPPYCVVAAACTRWSCCSRFQGSQFSFPIQLAFFFHSLLCVCGVCLDVFHGCYVFVG